MLIRSRLIRSKLIRSKLIISKPTSLNRVIHLPLLLGVSSALIFSAVSTAGEPNSNECYQLFSSADYPDARAKCQELAELGDAKAAFLLATMYYQALGTKEEDQRGLFWDKVAAEKGHPESAYRLGLAYQLGQGVSQSNSQARHWYQQAALAQHARAQKLLASMFETGAAGEKDQVRAYQLYLKAARQGLVGAQLKVGTMLLEGRGVAANRASAQHWIRKAAEAGNANAQVAMGVILAEIDPADSLNWYRRSAEQGNALALQNLALVYYAGQGVEADHMKAAELAQQAIDAGNSEASSLLNLIRLETEQQKVVELQAEKQLLLRQIRQSIPDNGSGEQQLLLATFSADSGLTQTSQVQDAEPATAESEASDAKLSDAADTVSEAARPEDLSSQDSVSQASVLPSDKPYVLADGWVMGQPATHFTIQLLYGTDEAGILTYIEKYKLPSDVRYYRTMRGADLYYVLVYGNYSTIAAAQEAVADIPAAVRDGLWIRKFRRLQEFYVMPPS